jgi:HK97 gp10 family phage protein
MDLSGFKTAKEVNSTINRGVKAVMKFNTPKAEEHMKHNAPWNDRTTNARNGLGARQRSKGDHHVIVLYHSVDYGVYLEEGTENMKAYPIIRPTIDMFAPRVQAMLVKLLDRL